MPRESVSTNAPHGGETGAEDAAVSALIAVKLAFLLPMTIAYFVGYIGLTALAGFARGFMAIKVVGAVNVGFMFIGCNYVLAWVLAIIYVRVANARFDPLAEKAVAAMRLPGVSR